MLPWMFHFCSGGERHDIYQKENMLKGIAISLTLIAVDPCQEIDPLFLFPECHFHIITVLL